MNVKDNAELRQNLTIAVGNIGGDLVKSYNNGESGFDLLPYVEVLEKLVADHDAKLEQVLLAAMPKKRGAVLPNPEETSDWYETGLVDGIALCKMTIKRVFHPGEDKA